ncbi:GDP-mannose 4,6-dehydratase [Mucilaginibacter sp.]|uniref:GDP-mannose 4,6-dehydratase n=1 Tax=Mucilaginibacter sp. TaxID=1882438 RepID=UPI0035BC2C23
MKAIIFGVNGQDGYYLSSLLQQNKIQVVGVSRSGSEYLKGDVSDSLFVNDLIKSHQPEYIFQLAANSTTRHDTVAENFGTITTGALNVLEAVYKYSKDSKVFIAGSGLQFVNNNTPIKETDAFEARDSYSMLRIQSVYTARYYRSLGISVYVGYFFNHDSPLRSARHVNQKIVLAAQQISIGNLKNLELGDISVRKEFTFAGDTVQAIWKLVNNDSVFEAVIGSGTDYSIADWLEHCFGYYNLDWHDYVVNIPGFSSEYKTLVCDPETIKSLGWQQNVDIGGLAKMMTGAVQQSV